MSEVKAGIGGEHYQPYAERTGGESVVFFTRDLSAEGLKKAYARHSGQPDPARWLLSCTPASRTAPTSSRVPGSRA